MPPAAQEHFENLVFFENRKLTRLIHRFGFLTEESKQKIQSYPLKEHFVTKEVFVKNLSYKINGDALFVEGDYDLKLEFEHEVPEELKNEPHFYREPMFGDFEVTIDRDKKITIEDRSIGENFDG